MHDRNHQAGEEGDEGKSAGDGIFHCCFSHDERIRRAWCRPPGRRLGTEPRARPARLRWDQSPMGSRVPRAVQPDMPISGVSPMKVLRPAFLLRGSLLLCVAVLSACATAATASKTAGPHQRRSRGEIRHLSQLRFRRRAGDQFRRQDHSVDHLLHAGDSPGDGLSRLPLHGGVAGSARQFPHQRARERCADPGVADLRLLDGYYAYRAGLYGLPVVMAEGHGNRHVPGGYRQRRRRRRAPESACLGRHRRRARSPRR